MIAEEDKATVSMDLYTDTPFPGKCDEPQIEAYRHHSFKCPFGITRHADAIEGAIVIPGSAEGEGRVRADDAHSGRVILTRARVPRRSRGGGLGWWYPRKRPGRIGTGSRLLLTCVRFPGSSCASTEFARSWLRTRGRPYRMALTMMSVGNCSRRYIAIEQRECCAEGVPHGCHGRGAGRVDHVLHG